MLLLTYTKTYSRLNTCKESWYDQIEKKMFINTAQGYIQARSSLENI
jgi:hypothetical protein